MLHRCNRRTSRQEIRTVITSMSAAQSYALTEWVKQYSGREVMMMVIRIYVYSVAFGFANHNRPRVIVPQIRTQFRFNLPLAVCNIPDMTSQLVSLYVLAYRLDSHL